MTNNTTLWTLGAVLFFIAMDYLTGVLKAGVQHNISSAKMREGLMHKLAYILIIILSQAIDIFNIHTQLGLPLNVLAVTSAGISLIELTSIVENLCEINPEIANKGFMKIFDTVKDNTNNKTENNK